MEGTKAHHRASPKSQEKVVSGKIHQPKKAHKLTCSSSCQLITPLTANFKTVCSLLQSFFVRDTFKLFIEKLLKTNKAEKYFNNQLDSLSTKFSGSQVCLRDLALVAYLCSNTHPRFTTLSYKDMHTTVHTELYSDCIFNSTHHQGFKEQVWQKISPSHSLIFNSDEKNYAAYSH